VRDLIIVGLSYIDDVAVVDNHRAPSGARKVTKKYFIGNHLIYVMFLAIISLSYWANKLVINIRTKTIFRWYHR